MTPEWQARIHSAIVDTESAGTYIVKGLTAIRDQPEIQSFIASIPGLARFVAPLAAIIPGIGEAEAVLNVADWGVEHWNAIVAVGAAVHFAPADGDALAALQARKDQDR